MKWLMLAMLLGACATPPYLCQPVRRGDGELFILCRPAQIQMQGDQR